MSAVDFREGDRLLWTGPDPERIDPTGLSRALITQPVAFVKRDADKDEAEVRFGEKTLHVPIDQLRRPGPPAEPIPAEVRPPAGFVRNWYLKPPPPKSLDDLRANLRRAHETAAKARDVVAGAAAIADRADATLKEARGALGAFADGDADFSDELIRRLRLNEPPPPPDVDREAKRAAAKRVVAAAEAASQKLTGELAVARSRLSEAEQQVRAAARAVIAEIALRVLDEMLQHQAEAEKRRASLNVLRVYWPKGEMSQIVLPQFLHDVVLDPTSRAADAAPSQWPELYARLLVDADADLEGA
jgi:hypothetical protein